MERLNGLDAFMLYSETPTVPMYTVKAAVLSRTDGRPPTFEEVVALLESRMARMPVFRRRLLRTPYGLHHPLWIDDPDFDLTRHIRRSRLPEPGTRRQLDRRVGEMLSEAIRVDDLPWEVHVMEGLEGDALAVVFRVHHALADGLASANILREAVRLDGGPVPPSGPADPVPDRRRLTRMALADHRSRLRPLPGLVRKTIAGMRRARAQKRELGLTLPSAFDAPATGLNGAVTSRRAFASTSWPLADAKALRARYGVTFTDVLNATVAGAMREVIGRREPLPDRPLVAGVPMALDDALRFSGNHFGQLFVVTPTHLADPMERLRFAHEYMNAAKEIDALTGRELFKEWLEYAPPFSARLTAAFSRRRLADRLPPLVNLSLSNVRGLRNRPEFGPLRIDRFFSVGPLAEGTAVNVTAWSFADLLEVSVLTCPDLLEDPFEVTDALDRAFAELQAVAIPDAEQSSA